MPHTVIFFPVFLFLFYFLDHTWQYSGLPPVSVLSDHSWQGAGVPYGHQGFPSQLCVRQASYPLFYPIGPVPHTLSSQNLEMGLKWLLITSKPNTVGPHVSRYLVNKHLLVFRGDKWRYLGNSSLGRIREE